MRLLSLREHSRAELRLKLCTRFPGSKDIDAVLDQMEAKSYLSDERFLEQYLEQRKRKGYGPLRIMAELRDKGVDKGLVEEAVYASGTDWSKLMKQVSGRKFGDADQADRQFLLKMARFLEYRGFPTSMIRHYLWDD